MDWILKLLIGPILRVLGGTAVPSSNFGKKFHGNVLKSPRSLNSLELSSRFLFRGLARSHNSQGCFERHVKRQKSLLRWNLVRDS